MSRAARRLALGASAAPSRRAGPGARPATSWQRGPRCQTRRPSLPGARHAFVRSVCVTDRGRELWVGDMFTPALQS